MSEDKHNFEELTAPSATAKKLHISVATLRKYSLIVEKVTGKTDYYARTKQNARLYSKQDVQDLEDFHQLAQDNGLTLQEAAQQVFAVTDKKDKPQHMDNGKKQEVMSTSQMVKLLNALQQTIGQQNTALSDLQKQLNRIEKQNKELLKKQKELEKPQIKAAGTDDDFSVLPDISGIVTDNGDDITDVQEMPETKPLTAAEKRAQVAQDEGKSSEQMHEEILAKAKENAEKSANSNAHRTLADMQIEPEKTHWWQRFLDM
ncbi:MerR family transcriptional regulator [Lactobacillus sp. M0398]|uniref:MerR family transcriptional regulator n=1 Tax=unclassified Lactobacillus TaxID=2620435 RepID=UPI0018DEAF25|nr:MULTISPECIES: MerR family transcriptional regulator [unclassified Lactobacillus]MBI0120958.1 MerR family transcriptional regulator [Lactobacillus sp. M0398]MBI0123105.1 MerR family transcriptional regulator [Lactobacillus sp. W8174]MBI0135273.1 MerR family transcriptional regulator [Lactobacillus sp. W8173]